MRVNLAYVQAGCYAMAGVFFAIAVYHTISHTKAALADVFKVTIERRAPQCP